MEGLIFNIQRYSIHDGQGIRTLVFFKGCPMRCPWCCNPESQSFNMETAKIESKCIHCKKCSHSADECPSGAIVQFGKFMTAEEIISEVKKDMIFYDTSNGGVTLSGGEVLAQPEFALELLKNFKKLGVNTALETSGMGSEKDMLALSEYLDIILFDLKIMNKEKAKKILGADMELIENNIKLLVRNKKTVIPRIPLIPGYTMGEENIQSIIDFVKELNLKLVHILPFHQYGSKKYEYLNREYAMKEIKKPSDDEINDIKIKMEQQGIKVVTAGL